MTQHRDWSDEVAKKIDAAVRHFLDNAAQDALKILGHYGADTKSGKFQELVDMLLERETLHRDDIEAIFEGIPRWTRDESDNLVPPADV